MTSRDPSGQPAPRGGQLAFDFASRPSSSGADFFVTACNAAAVAWVDAWPNWPAPALVIYGSPGCGKSHLASVWQARNGAIRLALPLDPFEPQIALGDAVAVVIEDVDGWIARDGAARQLFHLYNILAERRGHLLLTARAAPAVWPVTLADLRSRIAAAPAVAVAEPDENLMRALLLKLFADRQLKAGDDVIAFLLSRMERSFDAARRLVAALDAAALAEHRNVTVPLVGRVLREMGPAGRGPESGAANGDRAADDGGHHDHHHRG